MSSLCVEQDGIVSPETDSGFIGTESCHPTPTEAPSPLHQGAMERWDGLLCPLKIAFITQYKSNKHCLLYFKSISLSFDPVFQLFRTRTRIHTLVWLHHQICLLCYHAVARQQSSAQQPSSIQSNRGEPNPERHSGGGPSPALISAGLKKATKGRAALSHRVSFLFCFF